MCTSITEIFQSNQRMWGSRYYRYGDRHAYICKRNISVKSENVGQRAPQIWVQACVHLQQNYSSQIRECGAAGTTDMGTGMHTSTIEIFKSQGSPTQH